MKPIKGGRITTTIANQELIKEGALKKVTIHNQSEREITVIINGGNKIPLGVDESMKLGNLKVISIIIVERGSIVRFIGAEVS